MVAGSFVFFTDAKVGAGYKLNMKEGLSFGVDSELQGIGNFHSFAKSKKL
jgi:hypothetical protein